MLRQMQTRKSIDAHVQVLNGQSEYYFNVVTKQSTWTPASNLFDWTIVIRGSGLVTYRNRVTGSTSEHVPITLNRIITEDLRKLELPPPRGPALALEGARAKASPLVKETVAAADDPVQVLEDDEPLHSAKEEGDEGGGAVVAASRFGDWESFLDADSGAYYWCVRSGVQLCCLQCCGMGLSPSILTQSSRCAAFIRLLLFVSLERHLPVSPW